MFDGKWLMDEGKVNIAGLLIAAGLSSRMEEFKPLMLSNGNSFIIEIIRKMKLVCNTIVVVTGYKSERLKAEIEKFFPEDPKIYFAFNSDYEKGMFTSLKCGITNLPSSDWILYHFVDQPGLPNEFYKQFINQIDKGYNWIQPKYENKNGHPILLGKNIFQFILNASPEENLKTISHQSSVNKKFWQCNYPQVLQDIDTPNDYEKEFQNEHL